MKVVNIILMIFGAIFVLIILLAIIGFILFTLTPALKSQITIGNISSDALSSFDTKVDIFEKEILEAAESKQRDEFILSLSEDEINSKIVQMLAEDTLPFKDMKISLKENLLWIYLALKSDASNAKIGLIIKPEVNKDYIDARLIEFQLGRLPLPRSIDRRVEDIVNIFINTQNPASNLPVKTKTVEIANGHLSIKVESQPID